MTEHKRISPKTTLGFQTHNKIYAMGFGQAYILNSIE